MTLWVPNRSPIARALRGYPLASNKRPLRNAKAVPAARLLWDANAGYLGGDLVTGQKATAYTGTPESVSGDGGLVVSGSSAIVRIANHLDLSDGYTITLRSKVFTIDTWGGLFVLPSDNGNSNHAGIQRDASNQGLALYHGTDADDRIVTTGVTVNDLTDGNFNTLTITWNATTKAVKVFFNGENTDSDTLTVTPIATGAMLGVYLFAERSLNTTLGSDGEVSHLSILPWVGNAEALHINRDITTLYTPANQSPLLIGTAGVGPPDTEVNPATEVLILETPPVTVEFLPFVNVLPQMVTVVIETPPVQVVEFVDTTVNPITEVVVIETPQVEVFVGLDLDINPITANVEIVTPGVNITVPVEFLVATEATPLQYEVSVGGDVQMRSQGVVNAWRNEHGHVSYPFPAVISDQPADLSVGAGDPVSLSVTAIGAAAYQWYLDSGSGPDPLIGETAATLNTNAPGIPGTYLYSCVVLNGDDFGIRSKDGTVTVT